MEYIIGAIILAALAFFGLRTKRGPKAKVIDLERKDAALEQKEEMLKEDITDIEKELAEIEKKVKDMSPEDVEKFWNEEDS